MSPELISVWASRYGIDGERMISRQLVACATPSIIVKPTGVCIQLLRARIQKAERVVPSATSSVAPVCTQAGTVRKPNSITPRNVDSRKNAVRTS